MQGILIKQFFTKIPVFHLFKFNMIQPLLCLNRYLSLNSTLPQIQIFPGFTDLKTLFEKILQITTFKRKPYKMKKHKREQRKKLQRKMLDRLKKLEKKGKK